MENEYLAPAKINLTLRVLRRREDGFHEIESLLVPISLCDVLTITRRDSGGIRFTCSDVTLPCDDTNLVVRAARLFFSTTGGPANLEIALRKKIPHGAGLGGGSSDAATTLLALNSLYSATLSEKMLIQLAAQLGSDVPFFITRSAAWCRGRGEVVERAKFSATLPLLLVKPAFGVPTPWAYQRWRDSLEIPGIRYAAQRFSWGKLVNDLERPVFEKYVFLAQLKTWLLAQAEVAGALMSGSGATVFAVLHEPEGGEPVRARMAEEFGENLWSQLVTTSENP